MYDCVLYFRNDHVCVFPQGRTVEKFRVFVEPFFKVTWPVDGDVLGEIVLMALRCAVGDLPESQRQHAREQILRFSGVRSWPALAKSSRAVSVEQADGHYVVLPYRQEKGAFFPLSEHEAKAELSAANLGALVLEKVDECA